MKLLFIIPAFSHGGTNKSLMHILSLMGKYGYDIDIFVMSDMGPYKRAFTSYNVMHRDLLLASFLGNFGEMKKEDLLERTKKIPIKAMYFLLRRFWGRQMIEYAYRKAAKKIERQGYNTVIAMEEGSATHFASYIRLQKTAWIHCDYSRFSGFSKSETIKTYSSFKHIVCVSEYTRKIFAGLFPALKAKCHGIHNMIDSDAIIKMADEPMEGDYRFVTNVFNIISVGRLDKVKQFEIIPEIACWLKRSGCNFRWYIIGGGEEKNKILSRIEKFNVAASVIFLGEMDNPYPQIKRSDLLVCTSISEACPHVINEAKILHVPVITTNFGSAPEFIESGMNGIITSKENLKTVIRDLILDKEQYLKIKDNLRSFKYPNEEIICKLSEIL